MKNLKKVLALVLVVAMMASFAVSASAAFTDQADIKYTTAVDVLSGLGVISGYSDGSFRPTDAVTRGAFAKMTAYVMNGGTNAAGSYGSAAATAFSDVTASYTFANAIGYCVSKGIISGYTDGTFRAANKVTGVQAAKMLLGALGYSSDIEGYTGTSFAKNVLGDGEDAGLFNGMSTVDLTQPLTREAAAQMIWNAMQATMVKYSNGGVTITTPDGVQVSTGATAAEAVTTGGTNTFKPVEGATQTLELAEKYFPALSNGEENSNDLGRPVTEYSYKGDVIATAVATPFVTYTSTVTEAKVYTDLGLKADATVAAGKVIVNSAATQTKDTTQTIRKNNTDTIGGNGVITEIYKDSTGAIAKIVSIEASLAKVTSVTTKAATKTRGAYTAYQITLGTTPVTYYVYSSKVAETDVDTITINGTIAKDDYVMIYKDGATKAMTYVAPVETITGKVTAKTNTGVYTIGGTTYELAAAYAETTNTTTYTAAAGATAAYYTYPAVNADKDQSYYVDAYGYVVGIKAAAATQDSYGMILKVETYNALVDGKIIATTTATVATTDGEIVALKLDSAIAADYAAKFTGAATAASTNADEAVVKYSDVDGDGAYTLEDVTPTKLTTIESKKTTLATGLYGNTATKFVFANYAADKTGAYQAAGTVNVVTGVANVADYADTKAYAMDLNNDSIADVVFVPVNSNATTTVSSLTYVLGTYTQTGANSYVYNVIVDGQETTITVSQANLSAKTLYSTITVTGTTTSAPAADSDSKITVKGNALQNKGGLLFVGGDKKDLTCADSVPVYMIDTADGTCTTQTFADVTESVAGTTYCLTAGTNVTAIYVVYSSAIS